jgi:hypothetical protein
MRAISLAASLSTGAVYAADQATPEEAKALAEKAAAHFKEAGPGKAIAGFTDAAVGYVDREPFVVVYDPEHKIRGASGVPISRGKDAATSKDVDGKEFGKDIVAPAKTPGSGWVDYRMTNPATKKVGPKRSWVIALGGDYLLFVGAFGSFGMPPPKSSWRGLAGVPIHAKVGLAPGTIPIVPVALSLVSPSMLKTANSRLQPISEQAFPTCQRAAETKDAVNAIQTALQHTLSVAIVAGASCFPASFTAPNSGRNFTGC